MSAEQRREAVIVAARIEFAQSGYQSTSTEAIAKRVGVSQPYLFRLFANKLAIFLAVIDDCFDRLEQMFTTSAEGKTGEAALMAIARGYDAMIDNRDILQVQLHMWATACHDEEVRQLARRRMSALWLLTERLSGADDQRIMQFMATGMLLNVFAAMGLPRIKEQLGQILHGQPPR
jgi:AcrR family transcriptional regulator